MDEEKLVFTPSAVMSLLVSIEELQGKEISLTEREDGVVINIGTSEYVIEDQNAQTVEVAPETVDTVADIDEEGYDQIEEDSELEYEEHEVLEDGSEPIEGGIIKELVKTLALGGLVRLTKNALLKA